MVDCSIKVEGAAELRRLFAQAPRIVAEEMRRAMEEAVADTEEEVVARTPVDQGRLVQSIGTDIEGSGTELTGLVFSANVEYAEYVEHGTGIHGPRRQTFEIRPRFKKALKIPVGPGGFVIRKRVIDHPGMRPHWMFREGKEAAAPRVQRRFQNAIVRVKRRLGGG